MGGYEYRVDGGTPVDVGDVLTADVYGLEENTEYFAEVRAYDDFGNRSPWTAPVFFQTGFADDFIDGGSAISEFVDGVEGGTASPAYIDIIDGGTLLM